MQVWKVLHAARWKYRMQKVAKKSPSGHHRTTLSGYSFATKARIDNRKKNLLSSNIFSRWPHNLANFGPLAAEIGLVVWGTPANLNGFRILAALLHDTLVVGVSQTLWRWTEGTTYIRQGVHHVGCLPYFHTWCGLSANLRCRSETCCKRLAENTGCKSRQKSPSGHHRITLSGYIFATKAHIDNRKKTC